MIICSMEHFFHACKQDKILFHLVVIQKQKHVIRLRFEEKGVTVYYTPPKEK